MNLDEAHELIARHLEGPVAAAEYVQHVEYDPELRRWYVRFGCDGRDATTIYFDLHQRTLRYEVYFLPDPPANHLELYRYLLRRNHTMYGARFSIGPDGDLYLVGRVALEHLSVTELDRIIGVIYETVETWFQPVVGDRLRPPSSPSISDCLRISYLAPDGVRRYIDEVRARGAGRPASFGEVRGGPEGSSGLAAPPLPSTQGGGFADVLQSRSLRRRRRAH